MAWKTTHNTQHNHTAEHQDTKTPAPLHYRPRATRNITIQRDTSQHCASYAAWPYWQPCPLLLCQSLLPVTSWHVHRQTTSTTNTATHQHITHCASPAALPCWQPFLCRLVTTCHLALHGLEDCTQQQHNRQQTTKSMWYKHCSSPAAWPCWQPCPLLLCRIPPPCRILPPLASCPMHPRTTSSITYSETQQQTRPK
jgi:hypothetical protein